MIGAWSEHSDGVDPSNQNNPYSGAAYVFVRDANGAWAQQVFLKSSTSVPGWPVFTTGRFGSSVALHGRTVVVGALGEHLDPAGTVERISMKKARTVMASGGLEPVADDGGKGNHSVFASALIEALNENQGILDATLLFSKIRRPVMVNADQTPEYSDIRKAGHDGGDFLFVPR